MWADRREERAGQGCRGAVERHPPQPAVPLLSERRLHPWDFVSPATRGHGGSGSPNVCKACVRFGHRLPASTFMARKVGLLERWQDPDG